MRGATANFVADFDGVSFFLKLSERVRVKRAADTGRHSIYTHKGTHRSHTGTTHTHTQWRRRALPEGCQGSIKWQFPVFRSCCGCCTTNSPLSVSLSPCLSPSLPPLLSSPPPPDWCFLLRAFLARRRLLFV